MLYVSPIIFATASCLLRKQDPAKVKQLLYNLRQLSGIITTDTKVVDDALASSFLDFEAALQYYSATNKKVDLILTRNKKDFKEATIEVLTPDEYLSL